MVLSRELVAFSDRLGHEFRDPDLLRRALTHSSLSSPTRPDNQRLEFLGDRVLGLVMAEALLANDTEAREGQLAPRFNALVRKETCADVAREIDLGAVLRLGKSEMATGGRRKQALLGDAMEAVIAAVYLDAGFDVARAMILRLWGARVTRWTPMRAMPRPRFRNGRRRAVCPAGLCRVGRTGPDHAPVFTVEARLATGETARAEGRVKRQAEQAAAREFLAVLGDA
jgi:ribonuclease-3